VQIKIEISVDFVCVIIKTSEIMMATTMMSSKITLTKKMKQAKEKEKKKTMITTKSYI
jgi:hypothetical protein